MQNRVMVLEHCTSQRNLFINEVQVDLSNTFWVMPQTKIKDEKFQSAVIPKL